MNERKDLSSRTSPVIVYQVHVLGLLHQMSPGIVYDFRKGNEGREGGRSARFGRAKRPIVYAILPKLARLADENSQRPPSKQLKRPRKPTVEEFTRGDRTPKRKRGEWYRYQQDVLKNRLISFIRDIIEEYRQPYLVHDGAPAHDAWPQEEQLFAIQGSTILPWPSNSHGLTQVAPCWCHLKRSVTEVPFRKNMKQWTKRDVRAMLEAIEACEKGRSGVSSIITQMKRCMAHRGGDDFHG